MKTGSIEKRDQMRQLLIFKFFIILFANSDRKIDRNADGQGSTRGNGLRAFSEPLVPRLINLAWGTPLGFVTSYREQTSL